MPTERLLLIGAGGHAKVVYDALRVANAPYILEVRSDNPENSRDRLLDCEVKVPVGDIASWPDRVHVAIGDNRVRRKFGESVLSSGKILHTVIHPSALLSSYAHLSNGVFLAGYCLVAPSALIETGSIVNHGAVIDHDCRVGAWTHVGPRAVLGGAVHIGEECLVGSGAVILPGITLGDRVIVGSGAVVTRDIDSGTTVVGVPARSLSVRQVGGSPP